MMENKQCHDKPNTEVRARKCQTGVMSCPTGQVVAGSQQRRICHTPKYYEVYLIEYKDQYTNLEQLPKLK